MPTEIIHDEIYIGDCEDGRLAHEHPVEYDCVIAMASSDHDNVDDDGTFEIPDGGWKFTPDEHYPVFSEAVDTLRQALRDGETVLVHCNMGVSRAPSVTIAALAIERGMTYNEAFNGVQEERNIVNPTPELQYCSKTYIKENGGEV